MVRQAESYSWSGPEFSFPFADSSSLPHPHGTHRRYGMSNAPTTVGATVTLSTCMYGGEYRLINNMQSGSRYSFETCGGTFWIGGFTFALLSPPPPHNGRLKHACATARPCRGAPTGAGSHFCIHPAQLRGIHPHTRANACHPLLCVADRAYQGIPVPRPLLSMLHRRLDRRHGLRHPGDSLRCDYRLGASMYVFLHSPPSSRFHAAPRAQR